MTHAVPLHWLSAGLPASCSLSIIATLAGFGPTTGPAFVLYSL